MAGLVAILIALAVVCFVLAAFPVTTRVSPLPLGLAFLAAGVWLVPALDAAL